jgi:hypothetical protein
MPKTEGNSDICKNEEYAHFTGNCLYPKKNNKNKLVVVFRVKNCYIIEYKYTTGFPILKKSLNIPKFSIQSVSTARILKKGSIGFILFKQKFKRKGLIYETSTNLEIRRQVDR